MRNEETSDAILETRFEELISALDLEIDKLGQNLDRLDDSVKRLTDAPTGNKEQDVGWPEAKDAINRLGRRIEGVSSMNDFLDDINSVLERVV